jgi:hypothetical protein
MVGAHAQSRHTSSVIVVAKTTIRGIVNVKSARANEHRVAVLVEAGAAVVDVVVEGSVPVSQRIDHGGLSNQPIRLKLIKMPMANLGGGATCATRGMGPIAYPMTRMEASPVPSMIPTTNQWPQRDTWRRETSWPTSQARFQHQLC